MILATAFAILAPLNLGGFEISQAAASRRDGGRSGTIEEGSHRVLRSLRRIAPIYAGFTGVLALLLILAGDRPFIAVCHAMATLSTSGISPVGGVSGTQSGRVGELAVALFLLPAVSHRGLSFGPWRRRGPRLSDPQIQLMLISVVGITFVLFLRSFLGAAEIDRQDNLVAALQAIWGSLFTVLSFLTTTGFESHDWRAMQTLVEPARPGHHPARRRGDGRGHRHHRRRGEAAAGSTRSIATACARSTSWSIRRAWDGGGRGTG